MKLIARLEGVPRRSRSPWLLLHCLCDRRTRRLDSRGLLISGPVMGASGAGGVTTGGPAPGMSGEPPAGRGPAYPVQPASSRPASRRMGLEIDGRGRAIRCTPMGWVDGIRKKYRQVRYVSE